jgi:hypothetical protein
VKDIEDSDGYRFRRWILEERGLRESWLSVAPVFWLPFPTPLPRLWFRTAFESYPRWPVYLAPPGSLATSRQFVGAAARKCPKTPL